MKKKNDQLRASKSDCAAFPMSRGTANQVHQEGMTLRDYFAAKAVQSGLLMNLAVLCEQAQTQGRTPTEQLATISYLLADAMIEARSK